MLKVSDEIDEAYVQTAQGISQAFQTFFVDALVDAIWEGADNIEDILRNLLITISKEVFQLAIEMSIIRGIIDPLVKSAFGLTGTTQTLPVTPTSRFGNIINDGYIEPHQAGGIINHTAYFGMANGRVGSVAEEAAEAILPLEQTVAGTLGVRAAGAGSGQTINVNMTVYAKDADSFRRSKREIAGGIRQQLGRFANG
jgi:phage-related minor tail protein